MQRNHGFSSELGINSMWGTYRYELTPYVWSAAAPIPGWYHQPGTAGGVDLRPLSAQAQQGGAAQGYYFGACLQSPGAVPLATAWHMNDATATMPMCDAWQSAMGYRPQGGTLTDLLWDQLTNGSDPSGQSGPGPLVPGTDGFLRLFVPGHSEVKRERFVWGQHPHTERLRDMLRRKFDALHEQDQEHSRRVLDFWRKKYRTDWTEFVPQRLRAHVAGPLPHATTITESFNKADSDTLGPDLTWTELTSDFDVVSNRCRLLTSDTDAAARADSDLSSDDHYAQASVSCASATSAFRRIGVICRKDSSATLTFYAADLLFDADQARLFKYAGGAFTGLGTVAQTLNEGTFYTVKGQADGSTLKNFVDGVEVLSVTDTAITGNLRCGLWGFISDVSCTPEWDSFQAADLAAGVAHDRSIADGLGVAEVLTRLATGNRQLTDILANMEGYARLAAGTRHLTDTSGYAEAYARLAAANRLLTEVLGGTDATLRTAAHLRQLLESLGLADTPALQHVSGARALIHEMAVAGADRWTLGPV